MAPVRIFSGHDEDNKYFQVMELLFGGVPGRPRGDGFDGHAWWPLFSATPIEYLENYNPVMVESYRPIRDSGGAGLHRGGAGIEKVYRLLDAGEVSIHDDRETVPPWGINGGLSGGTSSKWIIRAGSEVLERIPSKIDALAVKQGDRIVFRTAGSGGWGDPLDREARLVALDVRHDLLSPEKALADYGVAIGDDGRVDETGTVSLRQSMRATRGEPARFNMGFPAAGDDGSPDLPEDIAVAKLSQPLSRARAMAA
jgi:N-methylhydantoinase B